MILLGKQGPKALADCVATDEMVFLSGEVDFSFRGRFSLPPAWCMLGYVHRTDGSSWCHGTPLASGMAFTVTPEGISEFALAPGSSITALLFPFQRLLEKFTALKPHQGDFPSRSLALLTLSDDERGAAVRGRLEALRDQLLACDGTVLNADDVDVDGLIEAHLLAALSTRPEHRPLCSRRRRTHYLIVQRAEDFMRQHLRRDIYMQELCNAAGVSERALRYAFEDLLGLSPNRYLSMLRLCMACRNLTLSDASHRSVKSVALSCGLWDLSRFADHYKRIFGERPSDTLMRAPPLEMA